MGFSLSLSVELQELAEALSRRGMDLGGREAAEMMRNALLVEGRSNKMWLKH